jgi:hypothetical protein
MESCSGVRVVNAFDVFGVGRFMASPYIQGHGTGDHASRSARRNWLAIIWRACFSESSRLLRRARLSGDTR